MNKKLSTVLLLSLWLLIACGGSEPEPIAPAVQQEPAVVAQSESEPTIVAASPVPPTAIPTVEVVEVEQTEVEVVEAEAVEAVAEPVAEERVFDPDADYNPPDFDKIFASNKPIFINSYADW